MTRSGTRGEHRDLAADLRRRGATVAEAATVLRERYGLGALAAARTARGWSQTEVAAAWSERWPDDPKTFKNVSYWENWPAPTGHAPSLVVLDRLAQLYGCAVADLVAGWGEHGPARTQAIDAERASLAWQIEHLDLHELSRSLTDLSSGLPRHQRRTLLLKLSTAASMAGGRASSLAAAAVRLGPAPRDLCGPWTSRYAYFSTGRDRECSGLHHIDLHLRAGRLIGHSDPTPTGSVELDLRVDGQLVLGAWTEHTSPDGYYGGAVYHGTLMLVLDPTGRSMRGRWLGPDRDFAVDSGTWTLTRGREEPVSAPAS